MDIAPGDLMPLVYDELRRLAAAKLSGEAAGYTLDATALVHEAWLKLQGTSVEWNDRTHFFRAAATAMRRILVDRARAKLTQKRDGGMQVDLVDFASPLPDGELVELDAALDKLAQVKPEHAKLVELRYFTGLKAEDAAAALDISPSTVDRIWVYAKAWLRVELGDN